MARRYLMVGRLSHADGQPLSYLSNKSFFSIFLWQEHAGARPVGFGDDPYPPERGAVGAQETVSARQPPIIRRRIPCGNFAPVARMMPREIRFEHQPSLHQPHDLWCRHDLTQIESGSEQIRSVHGSRFLLGRAGVNRDVRDTRKGAKSGSSSAMMWKFHSQQIPQSRSQPPRRHRGIRRKPCRFGES